MFRWLVKAASDGYEKWYTDQQQFVCSREVSFLFRTGQIFAVVLANFPGFSEASARTPDPNPSFRLGASNRQHTKWRLIAVNTRPQTKMARTSCDQGPLCRMRKACVGPATSARTSRRACPLRFLPVSDEAACSRLSRSIVSSCSGIRCSYSAPCYQLPSVHWVHSFIPSAPSISQINSPHLIRQRHI
jgi:hypothetical protein